MAAKKVLRWALPLCAAAALALGVAVAPAGAAETKAGSPPPAVSMSYPSFGGRLYGVTAISPDDVWAVGLNDDGSLALHWNGSTWAPSLTPPIGYFTGVASTSASDVWAVGGTNWFSPVQPFAEHWNGTSWTRVSTPNPPGGGYFNAVAATSPSNAWAVGLTGGGGPGISGPSTPLIEHWNGKRWTKQSLAPVPTGSGQLTGVTAISADNAWAVGSTGATDQQTLIEHWNGFNWSQLPSPNLPGATGSYLRAVTAVARDHNSVWAVGSADVNGLSKALVLHWDGASWTIVPGNSPDGDVSLLGVVATWTSNIWAVGIIHPSTCGNGGPQCQTLIEHWNSKRWKVLPSPNPPSAYLNLLWAASATSRGDIWAVGTTDYGTTLIEHWNGSSWS